MISYETWLNRVFGGSANQTPNVGVEPVAFTEYFKRTLSQSGTDLLKFSDKQVNSGLWQLFSSAGLVHVLKEPNVPLKLRTSSILAIKALYSDCFMQRARPILAHLGEPGGSPVNSICYMLWDITPIGIWGTVEYCSYFDLAIEVLEYSLYLPHVACVESALHGLGHLGGGKSERVQLVIDKWKTQTKVGSPELITYAQNAHKGSVQ